MPKNEKLEIVEALFNGPTTVVLWNDGTATAFNFGEDEYIDHEKGLAMAVAKKVFGNDDSYRDIFDKYIPKEDFCAECAIPYDE